VPLQVELVSPERILFSGRADMVIARTVGGGDIAFLPGHSPFVGALDIAQVTIRSEGQGDETVAVHGGFVEVSTSAGGSAASDGSGSASPSASAGAGDGAHAEAGETVVMILSDVAELADQIDVERARRAQQRAEERRQQDDEGEADAALRRAHVRLTVAGAVDA
jgi:F-type H+-transporting ATPase subunit epsilon